MNNLKRNLKILSLTSVVAKILTFLLVPLYTHSLSADEFGLADLLTTTVSLIVPLASFSIFEAMLRFLLESTIEKKQVFSIGIYTCLFGTTIAVFISIILFKYTTVRYLYIYFLFYFIINVVKTLFEYSAKGLNNIKSLGISNILGTVIFLSLNILFLLVNDFGVQGYLLAFIIADVFSVGYLFFKNKYYQYIIKIQNINQRLVKKLFVYSLPLIPNSISWWISNSSDKYIIALFMGTMYTGIYSMSYKIPSILNFISQIFVGAWQISAVEDFGSKKNIEIFNKVHYYYSSCLIISCSLIISFSKIIAKIFLKNEFFIAWKYIPLLTMAFVFSGMGTFLGTIFTSAKKTNFILISTSIAAALNIILNFIFIPYFGLYGAAGTTLFSYAFNWILRILFSKKIISFHLLLKENIWCILLLFLQIVMLLGNNRIHIIVCFMILIIKYKLIIEVFLIISNKIKVISKKG